MTGIKSFPRAVRALTGTDVSVKCVGVGAEYATGVRWTVDGEEVPEYGTDSKTYSFELFINPIWF